MNITFNNMTQIEKKLNDIVAITLDSGNNV